MNQKILIPDHFMIGTSSSAWQIEGCAGKSETQKAGLICFMKQILAAGMIRLGQKKPVISIIITKKISRRWQILK